MTAAETKRRGVKFTDLAVGDYPDAYTHAEDGDVWVDPTRTDPSTFGTIYGNNTLANPLSGDIDVFMTGGQSNGRGRGDSTTSPDPTTGTAYEWNNSTDGLVAIDDPVGTDGTAANSGSAWPQFTITYQTLTNNRPVCIVPCAVGGASVVFEADNSSNTWDPDYSGEHYSDFAKQKVQDCLTWLGNNGYNPVLRGCLWSQGEDETYDITNWNDTIAQDYITNLNTIIDTFNTDFGAPFLVAQTGMPKDGDREGFALMRKLQQHIIYPRDDARMVWGGALHLPRDGLMDPDTNLHYSQAGYDKMGKEMARGVLGKIHG